MPRIRSLSTLAVIAALAAAPLTAKAQPGPDPHHHAGGALVAALALTPTQRAAVHRLLDADRATLAPLMRQDHALHRQFAAALLGGASGADLAALQRNEESLRAQSDAQHLQLLLQIRALATPAQLSAAATRLAALETLHRQEQALLHPHPAN